MRTLAGRSSARLRTGPARTRPSMSDTAARKLKLWSAASREVGLMRPGSSFCRRSPGVSGMTSLKPVSPSTVPPSRWCISIPAATTLCPVARHGKALTLAAMMRAFGRQRRGQPRRRVALGKHRAYPARVLEQIERAGDAMRGQQRRLHAVLGHERVGDRLGGGNAPRTAPRSRSRHAPRSKRWRGRDAVGRVPSGARPWQGRRGPRRSRRPRPNRAPSTPCSGRKSRSRARWRR